MLSDQRQVDRAHHVQTVKSIFEEHRVVPSSCPAGALGPEDESESLTSLPLPQTFPLGEWN